MACKKQIFNFPTRFKKSLIFVAAITSMNSALANPQGEVVRAGSAVVSRPSSTEVRINQSSQNAVIDWKTFNINANEKTNFYQPANGITLNRVTTQSPSQIFGKLTATGRIILVNGAGIYFGPSAVVNVGGLIASTTDISNENFMAGNYVFDKPTANYSAKISNDGYIRAADHGLVALVGSNVSNNGYIQANVGNVVLASGNKFTFDFAGDQLINFAVTEATPKGGKVSNSGTILADGGKIIMSAQTASQVLDNAIDMSGVAQANSVAEKNGVIILMANNGKVKVQGKLVAEGQAVGSRGGNITLSAKYISVDSGKISVNGDAGGGNVTLGFTDSAGVVVANSKYISTDLCSNIQANAFSTFANGGNISVYADKMELSGNMFAMGKGEGSMGGSINLSGDVIDIESGASLNSSGSQFGGTIQVGGNYFSSTGKFTSSFIDIDPFTYLAANGTSENSFGGGINLSGDVVKISGYLDVSAKKANSYGGVISVQGDNVEVMPFAVLNASGSNGGGSVILGTNPIFQIPTSKVINVNWLSKIDVSATAENSFGGLVSIYGDDVNVWGSINASAKRQMVTTYGSSCAWNPTTTPSTTPGGFGGSVKIIANNSVTLGYTSSIDASGDIGGGMVIVGGAPFGLDPIANLVKVYRGSVINASAITNGDGGLVSVYSNDTMNFSGSVYARGGSQSGNGGNVQIAGVQQTNYDGNTDVSAQNGAEGTVVIGPNP